VNEGEAGTVSRCAQATKFHIKPNSTPLVVASISKLYFTTTYANIGIERFHHLCRNDYKPATALFVSRYYSTRDSVRFRWQRDYTFYDDS